MEDIKKKILEAFQRDIEKPEPENSYIVEHEEYGWEYDSLEEALEDYHYEESIDEALRGDQLRQYELGDIVMTQAFYSPSSKRVVNAPHRILVITSKKESDGVVHYRGFELSSRVEKSNKSGRYPHTLYIDNYNSIVDRKRKGAEYDKPVVLIVNDLVKFNSKDHSVYGSYKGRVTPEFLQFVQQAYDNYKSGRDNSKMYWDIKRRKELNGM